MDFFTISAIVLFLLIGIAIGHIIGKIRANKYWEAQIEKDNLRIELKEWLESLTYDKLAESEATQTENLQRQLRAVPLGIYVG